MYQSDYAPGSVASFLSVNATNSKPQKKKKTLDKLFTANIQSTCEVEEKGRRKRKLSEIKVESDNQNTTVKVKKRENISAEVQVESTPVENKLAKKSITKYTGTNEERPVDRKQQRENKKKEKEKASRTIFVGNLPTTVDKKLLKKIFKEFGVIESVRFRSAAPSDLKLPKRAVVIKKAFHKERHNINAYVVFKDKESTQKALKRNGFLVESFHIRVDLVGTKKTTGVQNSIFVGNLPFDAEEQSLREHFVDCGEVDNVRIIRDVKTGLGKGFGYVLFRDKDSVDLALSLDGKKFEKRALRIQKSSTQALQHKSSDKKTDSDKRRQRKRKFTMPSNLHKKDFQGIAAQKQHKIKKKLKFKKKQRKLQFDKRYSKVPKTKGNSNKKEKKKDK